MQCIAMVSTEKGNNPCKEWPTKKVKWQAQKTREKKNVDVEKNVHAMVWTVCKIEKTHMLSVANQNGGTVGSETKNVVKKTGPSQCDKMGPRDRKKDEKSVLNTTKKTWKVVVMDKKWRHKKRMLSCVGKIVLVKNLQNCIKIK